MSSKSLFASQKSSKSTSQEIKKNTITINNAGGAAYSLDAKAALTQLAMTGCFNGTYYASAKDQLNKVIDLADKLDPIFIAKLAVYARQKGVMKDMPAVLLAILANKDINLLSVIFNKVIDNSKMLRNFIQIIRSGVTGRKSLGTRPKKLIQNYLNMLTDEQLFKSDIGNNPSLKDIIRMVHPVPLNKQRSALYCYFLGKDYNKSDLCQLAQTFENFKNNIDLDVPNVPFEMLTSFQLLPKHWKQIAKKATWTQLRMSLNCFLKHGVFEDDSLVDFIANKLQDEILIKKSKVFPYQLYTAFQNVNSNMPSKIKVALQKATEISLFNVPEFNSKIYVLIDTSGSMGQSITGARGSSTSATTCMDVAALIASAILKKNIDAEIIPFDTQVHRVKLNPLDSIATNTKKLAEFCGGGTDCSCAINYLNAKKAKGDLIIMISDNESWSSRFEGDGTRMNNEWLNFKKNNKKSKLVCIDITPNDTVQVESKKDVLNLGGFNDSCFEVIAKFIENGSDKDLYIKTIESVNLI
jgi:60 kDa SS-A/Ro ribonucleoprotein